MAAPHRRRNDSNNDKKPLGVLFYLDFFGKFHLKFAINYLILLRGDKKWLNLI